MGDVGDGEPDDLDDESYKCEEECHESEHEEEHDPVVEPDEARKSHFACTSHKQET